MRNTEKERRSAAPNLLVQFLLAELTLQLAVDPSKSRRSIPARADDKSRRSIPAKADGRSRQEPTVNPNKIHILKSLLCSVNLLLQFSFLSLLFCSGMFRGCSNYHSSLCFSCSVNLIDKLLVCANKYLLYGSDQRHPYVGVVPSCWRGSEFLEISRAWWRVAADYQAAMCFVWNLILY
jgi:hypothetical protein